MMSDSISLPARRGAPFRPHRLRTFNVAPCSDSDSDIQAIVSDENGSTPRYSDDTPRNIGTLHIDSDSDNSIMLLTSSFSDPDATPISLRRAPIGDGALSYDWKNHMSNLQNAMTDSGANSMVWCDDITWCRSPVPTWPIAKAQPSFASWCTIIVFAMIIAVVATVIT